MLPLPHQATLILSALVIGLPLLNAQNVPFEETDGILVIEAEAFHEQRNNSERSWYLHTVNVDARITPDPDPNHATTASGGAYLEILPDTRVTHDDPLVHGVSFANDPASSAVAVLDYEVYINNPGRYYVWVRAYSTGSEDNGIHVGINGSWPISGKRMQWCDGKNQWRWDSKQRTIQNHCGERFKIYLDIDEPGNHTISFAMREDGFEFDRFMLRQDRYFLNSHLEGPPNSPVLGDSPRANSWWFDLPDGPVGGKEVPTLGWLNCDSYPWIESRNIGWVYDVSTDENSLWWYTEQFGWIWTSRTFYPVFYNIENGHWMMFVVTSTRSRVYQVYDFETGEWLDL